MTDDTVLLVEDTPSLARVYAEYLKKEGFSVIIAETGEAACSVLDRAPPRLMLLDLNLPDMDGMSLLRRVAERALPTAVVVITANASVNVAVEAMKNSAYDFLTKPFTADRLLVTVRNALERQRLKEIVEQFDEIGRNRYHGFIGSSLVMQAVYRIIDSAAPSRATVFVTGESGTGKEICAEAIHRQSPRRDGPFVAINCGAIPKDLMESEIFGHVKGAFTGASSDRDGAATRADGGTLFLDEICELEPNLQTKLLRFIQTGTFQRVGGTRQEKVDIRIVCATNRDPLKEVEEGRFREDLYYRLHVVPLQLPPLRDREDDVIEIAGHLLREYAREEGKRFTRFDPAVEEVFRCFPWPGNVRQLQNIIRNIVVLYDGDIVTLAMLPPPLSQPSPGPSSSHQPVSSSESSRIKPLWMVEKDTIEEAIAFCGGNIPRAAALLGISPSTIYRKRLNWEAEGRI